MPEPQHGQAQRLPLCASADLPERGQAHLFEVWQAGQAVRAFALRVDGRVVAYLNRCAHVPVELDWVPGQFWDSERQWILCSLHGAAYEPQSGRCAGGPCGRGHLTPIPVAEEDGQVYWYPANDLSPPPSP